MTRVPVTTQIADRRSVWTRRSFARALAASAVAAGFRPLPAAGGADWVAVVLGSIQDGGLPQAGCYTERCDRARRDPYYVASLGIVESSTGRAWLVDATPDLVRQMDLIPGSGFRERASARRPFEGILLTHAHVGHYLGLALLGREGLGIASTPCYCSARMAEFLSNNGPWSLMVDEGRLDLRILEPDRPTLLADDLSVTAIPVPHRDEYSDTLGFVFRGPRQSLLYLPDIDRWDRWDRRVEDVVAGVDVSLLDATFYSAAELPGRDQTQIPHPLVTDTIDRLEGLTSGRSVVLTHLNSTNPVLDPGSPERERVLAAGFGIARAGQTYPL
ncbi:MAG: MBL fold metallo-hydrolase [Candidatus Palauibacterales bacterium]|nr:MBL fold metallo-hydrolase [Candidatus Palauibacterales bacterium]